MKAVKLLPNFKKKSFKSDAITNAGVGFTENKDEEVHISGKAPVKTAVAFFKLLKHGSLFLIEILSYHPDTRISGVENLYKCGNDITDLIINFFKFSGLTRDKGLSSLCLADAKLEDLKDVYIMNQDTSSYLVDEAHMVSVNGDSGTIAS